VRRAARAFSERKLWHVLVERGMAADVSWDRSAREYAEVYERAIDERGRRQREAAWTAE
jgi:starch synthase